MVRLSSILNVSLDQLISNETTPEVNKVISSKDVCEMMLLLFNSNIDIVSKEINVTETCWERDIYDRYEIRGETRENIYFAFYFPNWATSSDPEEESLLCQMGNDNGKNMRINTFITRLLDVRKMYNSGNIPDEDMYHRLIESYLHDAEG